MDYAHRETDKIIKRLERKLRREFAKAGEEVREKLEKYLAAFAAKDAQKAKLVADGLMTESQYNAWRYGQIMIGKRWKEMQDTLTQDYLHAAEHARDIAHNEAMDVYALNHNFATYQVEATTGIDTSYTLYSHSTVARLIKESPKLLPELGFSDAKAMRWYRRKISSVMTQSILQGESIPKVASRMQEVTGMSYRASVRQARTAMTAAQNAGRVDAYERAEEEYGIKGEKMWVATLDNRTRHSHIELDGECVPFDATFPNGCRYPADPECDDPSEVYNCRCTLMEQIKGFEKDPHDMSWRNTRKLNGISYEDWKKGKKAKKK